MSAHRVGVNIICDGPTADQDCPDNASFMDALTADQIRARLTEEDGWATALPGGVDRCKACQTTRTEFLAWLADKAKTATGSATMEFSR